MHLAKEKGLKKAGGRWYQEFNGLTSFLVAFLIPLRRKKIVSPAKQNQYTLSGIWGLYRRKKLINTIHKSLYVWAEISCFLIMKEKCS